MSTPEAAVSAATSLLARTSARVHRVAGASFVVRAGRLVDGTGSAPLDDVAVLVEGGRIAAVGPAREVRVPAGADVHDYPNATVLPGLIDAHVHLTGDVTYDVYRRYLEPDRRVRPLLAAAHAQAILAAGFTTVRDLGLPGPARAVRDAVKAGLVTGPRILTAVAAIGQTGGHADWHVFPSAWVEPSPYPRGQLADGVDGCRRAVRRVMRAGADVIKLFLESGGVTNTAEDLRPVPEFSDDELRVLVEEAHRHGLRVAGHAKSREVIRRAVEFGIDTIEHADLDAGDADTFQLMAGRGVVLVPTLSLYHWVASEGGRWGVFEDGCRSAGALLPERLAMVKAAADAGVPIATGTDTGSAMGLGRNAQELALLVEAGLTPMAAIEAATRVAARALGVDHLVGTLEPGKLADLIVVDGDPAASVEVLRAQRNPLRVFSTATSPRAVA